MSLELYVSTGITAWLQWSILEKISKSLCFCFFAFFTKWPWIHGSLTHTTLISISLEFCFQHNFLPYWRFPPLHFLEEFLQNHSFSRAPLVENVKTKRKPAMEYKFTRTFWIVIIDRFIAFKINRHKKSCLHLLFPHHPVILTPILVFILVEK